MAESKAGTVDGVRAVELFYRPIREISSGDTIFYRTEMRLNAPNMGTMLPERYMAVLESSDRCIAVFKLAFVQLLQAVKKFNDRKIDFEWISVYMPERYLRNSDSVTEIKEICKKCGVEHEQICFEIAPTVFDAEGQAAVLNMSVLRGEGFHFMMTGYGGKYFPLLKAADYDPDYLLLDPEAVVGAMKNDRTRSLIASLKTIAEELNAELIVDDVSSVAQLAPFREMEFLYYTGAYSGNYMAERYMRTRNSGETEDTEDPVGVDPAEESNE